MPTVLIVDDDNVFRSDLRTIFNQGSGFDSCVEAGDGADAIVKTKHLSPNLAVLNFSLPDMTGLQLTRELKAIAPDLPIFMLMADNDPGFEKVALLYGITAVFSKLDDLTALVTNARAVCGIQ
jgi:DNA-binding NarL/FixJ family response regulator